MLYYICKQVGPILFYEKLKINILYISINLTDLTLIFIIVNTAYSISNALEHIELCMKRSI